jgi:hypothetical protein
MFFNLSDGFLDYRYFEDNELPSDFQNKTMCKSGTETYEEDDSCKGIALHFDRDRYTITSGDHDIGFCRFTSIKTVWDENLPVTTKEAGGPVTYISAQCAHTQKLLAMYWSKAAIYVIDKGK